MRTPSTINASLKVRERKLTRYKQILLICFLSFLGITLNASNPHEIVKETESYFFNPVIQLQPVSSTIYWGESTVFSVQTTSGTTYRWQYSDNGGTTWINVGTGPYSGATTRTLSINTPNMTYSGYKYKCILTKAGVSISTDVVTLTINNPILTQPLNQTICLGNNTQFELNIYGIGFSFIWQYSTNGGTTWINAYGSPYSGTTSDMLELNNPSLSLNEYLYRCVITKSGYSINSETAELLINTSPVFQSHPSNVSVCQNQAASFNVVAGGENTLYQWEYSSNGGTSWYDVSNNDNFSGATSTTLSLNDGSDYHNNFFRCKAQNQGCPASYSNSAMLTVYYAPVILTQPEDKQICLNGNTSFTISASGTNLQYQWQSSSNEGSSWDELSNNGLYSGANTATLSINSATADMNNYKYRCIVSGTCEPSIESNTATLSILASPIIVTHPLNSAVCESGGNASFTVVAEGAALTYSWEVNRGNGWENNIFLPGHSGIESSILNIIDPKTIYDGYHYRCKVTGTCSPYVYSNEALLSISGIPVFTQQPQEVLACVGSNAQFEIDFNSTRGENTYKWQESSDNGTTWVDVSESANYSGTVTRTLTVNNVNNSMHQYLYRYSIINACGTFYSMSAPLLLYPTPQIIQQPALITTICEGTIAVLNIEAIVSGPEPLLTYQWQKSSDNGATWVDVSDLGPTFDNATTRSLTIRASNELNNNLFRCWVRNEGCEQGGTYSNSATLSVQAYPRILAQPIHASVCQGGNTSFTVTASGHQLTYQWQLSSDGGSTWTNLSDAGAYTGTSTATLALNNVSDAFEVNKYRCVMNGTCGLQVITTAVQLKVERILLQANNLFICEGQNANFSVVVSGNVINYQWQVSSNNGIDWTNLTDGTIYTKTNTSSLNIAEVTPDLNAYQYRCIVTQACQVLTSTPATLNVNVAPSIVTQPLDVTVCEGNSATFGVTASGNHLSYHWMVSDDGGHTWNPLFDDLTYTGANTNTLNITSVSFEKNSNLYRCDIFGICIPSVISNIAKLNIDKIPSIIEQPISKSICNGSDISFTIVAHGNELFYKWQISTDFGETWNELNDNNLFYSGTSTSTMSISNATIDMKNNYYRCVLSGKCAPKIISNIVTLNVENIPQIITQPISISTCDNNATFKIVTSIDELDYQWQESTDGGVSWSNKTSGGIFSGTSTSEIKIKGATPEMNGYRYRCFVNGCSANLTSNDVRLTVSEAITITSPPIDMSICEYDNTGFTIRISGNVLSYQWQNSTDGGFTWSNLINNSNINGANTEDLLLFNVPKSFSENKFRCIVSNAECIKISNSVNLTIKTTPQITIQPSKQVVPIGGNVELSTYVEGFDLIYYQWQISPDPQGGMRVFENLSEGLIYTNVNSSSLIVKDVGNNIINSRFRCHVTNSCGSNYTDIVAINPLENISSEILSDSEQETANENINTTNCIPGSIDGIINISSTGAVTYNIPIITPPGSHGVKPDISINYNSQSGNGLLGYGWHIGGISTISRVNKNTYYDGFYTPVKLENEVTDNALMMDGVRLIKDSFDPNKYYPENHPYTIVRYSNNSFTVTTQDGMTIEYGTSYSSCFITEGSSATLSWAISKVIDANGNYIQYNYTGNGNDGYRINSINYTGNINSNLKPYNSIIFYYNKRKDSEINYYDGTSITNNNILSKIEVFAEGNLSKEYTFEYFFDGYSKLNKILLNDRGKHFNPTIVNWESNNNQLNVENSVLSIDNNSLNTYFGDVNGDYLQDIVKWDEKRLITVMISNQNGGYTTKLINLKEDSEITRNIVEIDPNTQEPITLQQIEYNNYYIQDIKVMDVNNDDKDEVFVHLKNIHYYYIFNRRDVRLDEEIIEYYSFNGSEFASPVIDKRTSLDDINNVLVNDNYDYYYGDFNNDGIIDRIETVNGILNSFDKINIASIPNISDIATISPFDFDGDGQTEMLIQKNNNSFEIWKYNIQSETLSSIYDFDPKTPKTVMINTYPGDFNGDGKTDILVINIEEITNSIYYNVKSNILYSTGKNFSIKNAEDISVNLDFNNIVSGRNINVSFALSIDDINNDGKSDIIYTDNRNINAYISYGMYFVKKQISSLTFDFPVYDDFGAVQIATDIHVVDLNGDGQRDFLYNCIKKQILDENPTHYTTAITLLSDLSQNLFVKAFTDGRNNETNIRYHFYPEISSNLVFPVVPIKKILLKSEIKPKNSLNRFVVAVNVETKNKENVISDVFYNYHGGCMHQQGKGFLGFSIVEVNDNITKVSSVTTYNFTSSNNSQIFVTWPNKIINYKNNILISTVLNNSLVATGGNLDKKLFMPLINSITSIDNLKNNITNTTIFFDETVGRINNQTTLSQNFSISKYTPFESIIGNKSRMSLETITVTNSVGRDITTNRYYYLESNPFKLLSTSTSTGTTISNTGYDNYGNVTNVQITTADGNRNSSCSYDTYGRFKITNTDAYGYISKFTYNSDGEILSETDANLLTITTTYDYSSANCIKVLKTEPDGNITTTLTSWHGSFGDYLITSSKTFNNTVSIYYNSFGRKFSETTKKFKSGETITKNFYYNYDGSIKKIEQVGISQNTTYEYYDDGRLLSEKGININTSYNYYGNTITITDYNKNPTLILTKTYDEFGNLLQSNSSSTGNVIYVYYPTGKLKEVNTAGSITSMKYDVAGNQILLSDVDAGETKYYYNSFNQLITQTDAKGQIITCEYDQRGRLISKTGLGINYNYSYYDVPGKYGLIKKITNNNVTETYDYDELCRLSSKTLSNNEKSFTTTYKYHNTNGKLSQKNYQSIGITIGYEYDDNNTGELVRIFKVGTENTTIWNGDSKNALGQWTDFSYGKGIKKKFEYNPTNYYLEHIQTGTDDNLTSIQDLSFSYNEYGQLINRSDNTNSVSLSENFTYDNMDRLKTSSLVGQLPIEQTYNYLENGNISSTSIAGQYNYEPSHPHAVSQVSVTTYSGMSSSIFTSSTYNIENKIETINNGVYKNIFTYGPDGNRFKVDFYTGTPFQLNYSKIYDGECEFVIDNTGEYTFKRIFIISPTGICAVYEKDATDNETLHYIHTDNQGSWLVISSDIKDDGSVLFENNSYDAWGRPRDTETWQLIDVSIINALVDLNSMQPRFDRGYTGHEHMAGFGLINMNGRLYDPYLQRFLSPDNYISEPENSQSYNRYTYCLNNPLKYTDPSGNQQVNTERQSYLVHLAILQSQGRNPFEGGPIHSFLINGHTNVLPTLMDASNIEFSIPSVQQYSMQRSLEDIESFWEKNCFGERLMSGPTIDDISRAEAISILENSSLFLSIHYCSKVDDIYAQEGGNDLIALTIANENANEENLQPFFNVVLLNQAAGGGDGNWAKATLGFIAADIAILEPTDAAWPKWVGYGVAASAAGAYLWIKAGDLREGTEVPWMPNDGFDNNEHYYRPGNTPPKWFWPSVAAAAAYELYKNWPKPEPLKTDKTKVVQPVVKPLPAKY